VFNTPSKYTLAKPDHGSSTPIQEIPVPVNAIDARAFRALVNMACPPLLADELLEYQLPV
jgi:hypothetical protein